jgi:hypothetical protein
MCIKEEKIKEIVINALQEHEKKEFANHRLIEKELEEVKKIAIHNSPSPKTIARLGDIQDMANELKASNDRLNRVVFGDPLDKNDIGMHGKIDEMYTKLIQVGGIKGLFKWILLTGGVTSTLYLFFKKF